ncbi:hypothetical protein JTB14_024183 [Gonioctena quinquepunctata]|nr:hypothetical protein JTB14_024183 [Gonioctena quinquepunctata]
MCILLLCFASPGSSWLINLQNSFESLERNACLFECSASHATRHIVMPGLTEKTGGTKRIGGWGKKAAGSIDIPRILGLHHIRHSRRPDIILDEHFPWRKTNKCNTPTRPNQTNVNDMQSRLASNSGILAFGAFADISVEEEPHIDEIYSYERRVSSVLRRATRLYAAAPLGARREKLSAS